MPQSEFFVVSPMSLAGCRSLFERHNRSSESCIGEVVVANGAIQQRGIVRAVEAIREATAEKPTFIVVECPIALGFILAELPKPCQLAHVHLHETALSAVQAVGALLDRLNREKLGRPEARRGERDYKQFPESCCSSYPRCHDLCGK